MSNWNTKNKGRNTDASAAIAASSKSQLKDVSVETLSVDQLRDRINNGTYDNQIPYPERSAGGRENRAELMTKYRLGQRAAEAKFKADIEQAFFTTNHPKADLLYSVAWEEGHSSGLSEVLNCYEDLAELIR